MKAFILEGDSTRTELVRAAIARQWPDGKVTTAQDGAAAAISELTDLSLVVVDCAAAQDALAGICKRTDAAVVAAGGPGDLAALAAALEAGAAAMLIVDPSAQAGMQVVLARAVEQAQARREMDLLRRRVYALQTQLADKDRQLRNAQVEKQELALADPLTDLCTRRRFCEALRIEFDRVRRYGAPVSCIMVDIDHFRHINNSHGFEVGDGVLQRLAEILSDHARRSDLVARYADEELAVLCPHTAKEGALTAGERIRLAVAEETFGGPELSFEVTVSVGIASFPDEGIETPNDLLNAADGVLRRAKAEGRNRVCVYGDDPRIEE